MCGVFKIHSCFRCKLKMCLKCISIAMELPSCKLFLIFFYPLPLGISCFEHAQYKNVDTLGPSIFKWGIFSATIRQLENKPRHKKLASKDRRG